MNIQDSHLIAFQCEQLVNLFSIYNDQKNFAALSELFTEDGAFARPTDPDNFSKGKKEILAGFLSRPNNRITRHIISNVNIEVIDSQSAKGLCYATLFMAPIDAEPATFGLKAGPTQFVGEFYMDFALTSEGWKIARQTGKIILST